MTTIELYTYVKDLVNRNSTGKGADLSKGLFVKYYNTSSKKYVTYLLNNRNDDVLRSISNLRTVVEIEEVDSNSKYNEYAFPGDYLDFINVTAKFKGDYCPQGLRSQIMKEVKPEEIDLYYNDPFNEPSIKHAESLYNLSGKGIFIYKKGFEIEDVNLYYYRNPQEIDIEGYKHEDGEVSTTIDPDLSDQALLEVALMIAKQFTISTDDYNKAQFLQQQQQIKK